MIHKKINYRNIAALSPKRLLKKHVIKRYVALNIKNYLLLILFFQAALLSVALVLLVFLLQDRQNTGNLKEKNFIYWSSVAGQYPNKPDILFNTSKSAYESGRKEQAIIYLEKALQIDPLFKKAETLLQEIKK